MRQMRVTRSQARRDRPVSPQFVATGLSADDVKMEEEDKFLMLEFGYGDEAGGDLPMSPTSLSFPGFALKSYDQLQDFL